MDTLPLKFGVPCLGDLPEGDWEGNAEEGVGCLLKKHKSFLTLEVVEQIDGAIVRFHLRYLKPI